MSDEIMDDFEFPVKDGVEMVEEGTGQEVDNENIQNEEDNASEGSEQNENEESHEQDIINKANEEASSESNEEDNSEENEANENEEDGSTLSYDESGNEINSQEVETEEIDHSSLIEDEMRRATGDVFKSPDEFVEAYNGLLETVSGKTYLDNLNEAAASEYGEGVSFSDLVEYKNRDFDNMDDLSVVSESIEKEFGDITPEQLEAHMRPYALLKLSDKRIGELIEDGEVTQTQVDDLKARLTRKAMTARSELKGFQDSINIDELEISSPEIADTTPTPQESEADRVARLEAYNQVITSMPGNTFEFGTSEDPKSFTIEKTDEDRNGVSDFLKGDTFNGVDRNFIDRHWTNEDGSVNIQKLSEDMYKVINYERDVKLGIAHGKSEKSKEVKDINNINFDKRDSGGSQNDGGMSQAAAMAIEANS